MPTPRQGESVPLVTIAAADDGVALAGDPGAVDRERDEPLGRAGPSRTARTASAPMKPVSSLQHHPSPASIGPRSTERSLP